MVVAVTTTMPSLLEWFFWFAGFAPFVLGAFLAFAMQLRFARMVNKWRYLLLMCVYVPTFAVYGSMALGEGLYTRPDSVTFYIARYWLYLATHGAFFAFLATTIVPNVYAGLLAGLLASAQQLALLLAARSTGSGIWFWFIMAGVAWLVNSLLFLVFIRAKRQDEDSEQEVEHLSMQTALGVPSVWIIKGAAVVGGAIYLGLFVLDRPWQDVVSVTFQGLIHLGVDIAVKLIAGLILLYLFKPQREESVRNFVFGPLLGETGDVFARQCNDQIGAKQPNSAGGSPAWSTGGVIVPIGK